MGLLCFHSIGSLVDNGYLNWKSFFLIVLRALPNSLLASGLATEELSINQMSHLFSWIFLCSSLKKISGLKQNPGVLKLIALWCGVNAAFFLSFFLIKKM